MMTDEDHVYGDTANIFGSDPLPLPVGVRLDLDIEYLRSRLSHPESLTPDQVAVLQKELADSVDTHRVVKDWGGLANGRAIAA